MTYVGELGWELTGARSADARSRLRRAVGAGATWASSTPATTRSSRCGWRRATAPSRRELTPDYTPVEAGLVFATALKGDKDFLGRAALEAHREPAGRGRPAAPAGVVRASRTPTPMLWGGELLLRDGEPAGQVTSAAWGETVGACGRPGLPALRRAGHRGLAGGRRGSRSTSRGSGSAYGCR